MVVVDTNILTYLLIAGDQTKGAQALFARDPDWKSEAFLLVEFCNVLSTYRRLGELSRSQAERLPNEAEVRISGLINLPHITALRAAEQFAYPPTTHALLLQRKTWVPGS